MGREGMIAVGSQRNGKRAKLERVVAPGKERVWPAAWVLRESH